MSIPFEPFGRILVAPDFSENACARSGHVARRDVRWQSHRSTRLTNLYQVIADLPYSDRSELMFGNIDVFERAVREESQA